MAGDGAAPRFADPMAVYGRRRQSPSLRFATLWLAFALCACEGTGSTPFPGNLLQRARPVQTRGITHVERLTDGATPIDGDAWLTDLSAVFEQRDAFAVYDLGRSVAIS